MPLDRDGHAHAANAGFTLIEALVALAVAAACLAAIGSLMAANIRGSGKIAEHLGLVTTLRAVETGLPDRTDLVVGTLSDEIQGHTYFVEITPSIVPDRFDNPRAAQFWTPRAVGIKVTSPSGGELQLTTIRLAKITGGQ
jgi:general secretion pathway protein I